MKFKKLMAVAMAATMVLGSSMTVFAADTDIDNPAAATGLEPIEGDGQIEAYISKEVFKVTLPTVNDEGIKFTADPQGLLNIADSDTYTTGAGSVFFLNATDDVSKSDDIIVKNKSSYDVDVRLSVGVTGGTGVTVVDDVADLTAADTPSLYFEITDNDFTGSGAVVTPVGTAKNIDNTLDAIEYEIDAQSSNPGGYTAGASGNFYGYIPVDSDASEDITFNITGKCDTTADWTGVTLPSLSITWSVVKHDDAPADVAPTLTGATTITVSAGTPATTTISLGSGTLGATGVAEVYYTSTQGAKKPIAETSGFTYSSGTFTFTAATVDTFLGGASATRDYKIVLNDDAGTVLTVTLSKN